MDIKIKGIVLAGGTGSRLLPFTKVTNKHLLPVGDKPMILHPIDKLRGAGITDIMIVSGLEHLGSVVGLLGSGKDYGCKFTYKVQDEAGGIAQALGLCEEFVGNDKVVVILGDNIFEDDLKPYIHNWIRFRWQGFVLLKEVKDAKRFGVAEIKDGRVVRIEEKPDEPKSNLAVTGIYMYDCLVWDFIRNCKRSHRGELEITDVNNAYAEANLLGFNVLEGEWTDAGTLPSYHKANRLTYKGKLE